MNKLLVFIIIVGFLYLSSWAAGGSVGAGSSCENGRCLTYASSSLLSIVMSLGLLFFLYFYPQQENSNDSSEIVGVWRRLGAFYLDFMVALIGVTPLLALPLLIQESSYTGQFEWAFERDISRSSDNYYILTGVGLVFWFLFYYFYKHPKSGRQTVGQYVLGYKVISGGKKLTDPEFGIRVIYSCIGLCTWPISLYFALKNSDKAFWWDGATNTKVIRVTAVNQSLQQKPAE